MICTARRGSEMPGSCTLNAVALLFADIRLGHAELVNAVADGAQGLVQGKTFQALHFRARKMGHIAQLPGVALLGFAHTQLGKMLGQKLTQGGFVFRPGQRRNSSEVPPTTRGRGTAIFSSWAMRRRSWPARANELLTALATSTQGQVDAALEVKPEVDFALGQHPAARAHHGHAGQGVGPGARTNTRMDRDNRQRRPIIHLPLENVAP